MATCRFCNQRFENSQAVRAHLKGCAVYKQRPRQPKESSDRALCRALPTEDSLGEALGNILPREESLRDFTRQRGGEYDEVTALEKRLAIERLRLKLRGVEAAHAELDERSQRTAQERERQGEQQARTAQIALREQEESRRRGEQALQERGQREKGEREKAERRRAIVQQVKRDATSLWWPTVADVTALKSDLLRAIESALANLSIEEIPHDELVLIAQGIRDRLTREAEHALCETHRLSETREKLTQHGIRYGDAELQAIEDLEASEKWRIVAQIKSDLSDIRGDETTAQVEDRVDGTLEAEGIVWDDEEDEYEDD